MTDVSTPSILQPEAKSNEFDLVNVTLDEQLELERQNAENRIRDLEDQLNDSDEKQICYNKISNPKNAFSTRVKITSDKVTIEPLKYNGCVGDLSNENSESSDPSVTEDLEETEHPNTIRSYVAAMLAFFSNLRIEYLSDGKVYSRKLPVFYGNREKLLTLEDHEFEDLFNGNTNYLPRASLTLDSMQYDANRQQNKNASVSRELTYASLAANNAFAYNQQAPSPYNISVRLNLVTRGMQDAMMLVEQVASYFNPFYTFALVENGIENSVRMQLEGVTFEHPELDQYSSNEFLVEFNFVMYGNMYKPRTKEYIIDNITLRI